MKHTPLYLILALTLIGSPLLWAQQNAHPSAALEVDTTTKGFLPPRMTTAQRDAIASPASGLMIYNTSTQKINFYNGSSNRWVELAEVELPPLNATAVANFTFASTANFLEDNAVYGDYQVVVTNNSTTSTLNLTFATSDITFSGVTGVSVTAVSDAAETIAPGASHTVSYTLSGTPGNAGTLTGVYASGSLSANANITVDANPLISHNSKNYYAVRSSTGKTWLDRNLGADQVATASNDSNAYGDFYQWGRNTDGHQSRTSSITAGPVASGSEGSDFITASGDWLSVSDATRWNGTTKGTHDPCPTGYRVPTGTELENERLQFSTNNAAGAFASVLKFSLSGFRSRSSGSLSGSDSSAYYWSSVSNGSSNGDRLFFNNSNSSMGNESRAYGFAIRCIKE